MIDQSQYLTILQAVDAIQAAGEPSDSAMLRLADLCLDGSVHTVGVVRLTTIREGDDIDFSVESAGIPGPISWEFWNAVLTALAQGYGRMPDEAWAVAIARAGIGGRKNEYGLIIDEVRNSISVRQPPNAFGPEQLWIVNELGFSRFAIDHHARLIATERTGGALSDRLTAPELLAWIAECPTNDQNKAWITARAHFGHERVGKRASFRELWEKVRGKNKPGPRLKSEL